ncbi:MAG TPA: carboxypeptidase regulatory-like domain-containing protein [Candidatus Eisenbacteria bacterium]|nr:carboxypeptidase regulatory-like domain-containing protein [Candidatus Eisenbacteria bacterium]
MIGLRRTHSLPAILFFAILLTPALASAGIWLSSITGACVDEDGKPLAGAALRFTDPTNGRHFEVTTGPDGKFTYIAVEPAHYRLEIYRARHQQVTFPGVFLEWSHQPLLVEINLQKNSVTVTRQVILAESFTSEQPALATPEGKDAAMALAINKQIAAAKAFMDAGDWDSALSAAKAATEIDPTRDLPWAWLANVFCEEAAHTTGPIESMLQSCVQNYRYAIAIAPNATYYNNLGAAYSALKNWKDAADNFRTAAQINPDHAALYHQNLGAALMNQAESLPNHEAFGTMQLALGEFSLAAAATPPVSEAYYWVGLCQLRLAAAEVSGSSYKLADESLRRYLQLAPTGQYASQARAMLDGLQDFVTGARHAD